MKCYKRKMKYIKSMFNFCNCNKWFEQNQDYEYDRSCYFGHQKTLLIYVTAIVMTVIRGLKLKKYKKEIKFSNKKVEENGKMLQKAIGLLADYHWRTTIGGQFDELASINKHALNHLADNLANI